MSLSPAAMASRISLLRERDGDDCWLCLGPIDFALAPGDRMAKSLDHVIPRSAGGSSRMSNLKLAHRKCNSDRGSKWVGEDPHGPEKRRERGKVHRKRNRDGWPASRQVPGGLVIGDQPVMPCALQHVLGELLHPPLDPLR
jgi:hypothetical protein